MTKYKIQNKSQAPSTKFQINPVTDEMKNNWASNGLNCKFQLPNDQNMSVSNIGILVIGACLACLPARQGFGF